MTERAPDNAVLQWSAERWPLARLRRRLVSVLLVACLLPGLVLALPGVAFAASPTESPFPTTSVSTIDTGDSRSNGQGPGLVGSPFAIAIGVVLLGLVAAGGTLLYVRLSDRH